MVYQYKWSGHNFPVAADSAGAELERIEKEKGTVTPHNLLEESTPEDSVMHPCFTWNDKEAAIKQRLSEARQIIRSIVRVCVSEDEKREEKEIRAYVNINPKSGHGAEGEFISVDKALSDEETRRIVLKKALDELSTYRRKYQEFSELSKVFSAIDEAEKDFEEMEGLSENSNQENRTFKL